MSVCPVTSFMTFFFFSSRRRHTRWPRDWSSDVCSSDLPAADPPSPDAVAARRGSGATTPPCLVLPWDLQCAQATGGRVRGAVYVRAGPSMGTLRSMPEHPGADAASEAPDRPAAHESCAVVWDDAFTEYDFGRFHPMAPVRLTLTRDLARASEIGRASGREGGD